MNSKKIVFIQKNKGLLLPIEKTLNALDINQQFPLQNYVPEEIFQHFQSFQNSINTVANIANQEKLDQHLTSILKFVIQKRKNIAIIDEFSTFQLSNHLNLPLKELSLNRDFLEKWLLEEEGKLNNGRPET
ncbi:MAG: hypothetical protein VKK32_00525 [Candidatus Melainabacteria bacterium]|nr:hypothetical protein [Candidatus Melainabacteria bacterium]